VNPSFFLVQYAKEHAVVPRLDRLSKLCDLVRFGNNQQVSTLRIFRVSAERTTAEQPDGPVGESIAVSSHKLCGVLHPVAEVDGASDYGGVRVRWIAAMLDGLHRDLQPLLA